MAKKALKSDAVKGLFCLETHTWGGPKSQASIEPTLQLLDRYWDVPPEARYVHHSVATGEELVYCLQEYCDPDSGFDTHPILILSFHGFSAGKGKAPGVHVGSGEEVDLNTIAEFMEGGCENRIIYFSSCGTMNVDERRLRTFLKKTGALAVCGYKQSVPWVASAAFEVMFLGLLQSDFNWEDYLEHGDDYDPDDFHYGHAFDLHGMKSLVDSIEHFAPKLRDRLGFRMVLRDPKGKR